jgi:hypothetical protein
VDADCGDTDAKKGNALLGLALGRRNGEIGSAVSPDHD